MRENIVFFLLESIDTHVSSSLYICIGDTKSILETIAEYSTWDTVTSAEATLASGVRLNSLTLLSFPLSDIYPFVKKRHRLQHQRASPLRLTSSSRPRPNRYRSLPTSLHWPLPRQRHHVLLPSTRNGPFSRPKAISLHSFGSGGLCRPAYKRVSVRFTQINEMENLEKSIWCAGFHAYYAVFGRLVTW